MEDYNSLQARRQAQAMRGRSRPGPVMNTTAIGFGGPPGLAGSTSGSGVFMPSPGAPSPGTPGAVGVGAPPAATTVAFGGAPSSVPPPAQALPATTVSWGSPQKTESATYSPQDSTMSAQPPAAQQARSGQTGSTPLVLGNSQAQMTNAQKISAQLAAFGIQDMVMPNGMQNQQGGGKPPQDPNSASGSRPMSSDGGEQGGRAKAIPRDTAGLLGYVPRAGLQQCYIVREKSFGGNAKYRLYLESGDRFILSGRKRTNKQTSNYLVSLSENDLERTSDTFYGKVRANFTGLQFIIYDKGENPTSGKMPPRQEQGVVLFEQNIGGVKGPRKMKVLLPTLNDEDSMDIWQPAGDADSMLNEYRKDANCPRFITLVNKAPTWNEQLRAYQLNFHGRVTKASVKNFQLCDSRAPNRVVLQFGKIDDNRFTLDYQYPLNIYQAFCIALTSFDNKLACD